MRLLSLRLGLAVLIVVVAASLLALSCSKEKAGDAQKPATEATATVTTEAVAQEWTCPMHPEVRSDEPGVCPVCNMNLVPVEKAEGQSEGDRTEEPTGAANPDTVTEWTCGMHPAIRSKEPGKCPICNMDLVPVKKEETGALEIDPKSLELVGAGREEVRYLPLVKEIWAVGQVEYDERRVKDVASRVPGRVENLYADFVGTEVSQGEPLLAIYSPELVTALAEYKTSLDAAGAASGGDAVTAGTIGSLAQSAKVRLLLWGLSEREIEQAVAGDATDMYRLVVRSPISGTVIEKNVAEGKYVKEGENLLVVADLSHVWLTADVYEDDIGRIRVGDMVMAHARAYPDEAFSGKVVFIDPYVDERTRAVRIRMEMENPDGKLKPGMYLEAHLEAPIARQQTAYWTCPMHPDVVAKEPGECPECGMFLEKVAPGHVLGVPEESVVRVGDTPVVYVERGEGAYELREVDLGELCEVEGGDDSGYYPVLAGLIAGDRVITGASFLVHSQARLTGKAASAYGGALQVEASGHHH
jgi:Cu(I)/Ag(I) efflux system membrane fusion protein